MVYLLQEGPAQTTGYMLAGYGVIFGVMAFYLVSLILRARNLRQDLQTLEDLDQKSQR